MNLTFQGGVEMDGDYRDPSRWVGMGGVGLFPESHRVVR